MPASLPCISVALVDYHYLRGLARLVCLRLYQRASLAEVYRELDWFGPRALRVPRSLIRWEKHATRSFEEVADNLDSLWQEYRVWVSPTLSLRCRQLARVVCPLDARDSRLGP